MCVCVATGWVHAYVRACFVCACGVWGRRGEGGNREGLGGTGKGRERRPVIQRVRENVQNSERRRDDERCCVDAAPSHQAPCLQVCHGTSMRSPFVAPASPTPPLQQHFQNFYSPIPLPGFLNLSLQDPCLWVSYLTPSCRSISYGIVITGATCGQPLAGARIIQCGLW